MIILYIAIVIVYCLIFGEYIHVDFNAKYAEKMVFADAVSPVCRSLKRTLDEQEGEYFPGNRTN